MNAPPTGEQLASLRERIIAAGRSARQVRLLFSSLGLAGGCAVGVICGAGPIAIAAVALPLAVLGWILALVLAADFRQGRAAEIRHDLGQLSREEVSQALLRLRSERLGDTRRIAASLIRDMPIATEISPAPSPAGRGDEPSPARQTSYESMA
jgi:hypothetical protein